MMGEPVVVWIAPNVSSNRPTTLVQGRLHAGGTVSSAQACRFARHSPAVYSIGR
jgi:hypothetical protein